MIREFLRHWGLIDLHQFRNWITDERIEAAKLIDNRDGSWGRSFSFQSLPETMIIARSDTLAAAMERGMDAVAPLSTAAPRRVRLPPSLQDLLTQHGRYDLITPAAWAEYDRAVAAWRADYLANKHVIED